MGLFVDILVPERDIPFEPRPRAPVEDHPCRTSGRLVYVDRPIRVVACEQHNVFAGVVESIAGPQVCDPIVLWLPGYRAQIAGAVVMARARQSPAIGDESGAVNSGRA